MGHIFISYSHRDNKYVEKLEKKLIGEGFKVWIDHRIDFGAQWPKAIQNALDACDAFIVVVSRNSFESEWVQHEVARAKRKGKPFFPLLLQGDPWLSVEATQYVKLTNGALPPESFYDRLEKVSLRKKSNKNTKSSPKRYAPPKLKSSQPILRAGGIVVSAAIILVSLGSVLRNFSLVSMDPTAIPTRTLTLSPSPGSATQQISATIPPSPTPYANLKPGMGIVNNIDRKIVNVYNTDCGDNDPSRSIVGQLQPEETLEIVDGKISSCDTVYIKYSGEDEINTGWIYVDRLHTVTPTSSPTKTNTPITRPLTNTVTVQPDTPPVDAYIFASPTGGRVPLYVSFTINLNWSDGYNACKNSPCTYYWRIVDYKDHEIRSGVSKSFSHTFQLPVSYSVYATACFNGVNCDNAWIGITPSSR